MKAETLATLLMGHPEHEVEFSILEKDGTEWGVSLKRFTVTGIGDIGHADKRIVLTGERN